MTSPDETRVYEVERHGDLLLTRLERTVDQERPGITAIHLTLVNRGTSPIAVDRVDFSSEDLSVTISIDRTLEPGHELVLIGPDMADRVTLQASIQGKSALFKAGVVFQATVYLTGPQGSITFTQPLSWGFWMEGGYGFTLSDA